MAVGAIGDIFQNNDTIIQLLGLKDQITDTFINDADVTLTIYEDTADLAADGISWPLTLPNVAASNGDYQVVVDKAIVLVTGQLYKAVITVVDGTNDGEWVLYLRAQERA